MSLELWQEGREDWGRMMMMIKRKKDSVCVCTMIFQQSHRKLLFCHCFTHYNLPAYVQALKQHGYEEENIYFIKRVSDPNVSHQINLFFLTDPYYPYSEK